MMGRAEKEKEKLRILFAIKNALSEQIAATEWWMVIILQWKWETDIITEWVLKLFPFVCKLEFILKVETRGRSNTWRFFVLLPIKRLLSHANTNVNVSYVYWCTIRLRILTRCWFYKCVYNNFSLKQVFCIMISPFCCCCCTRLNTFSFQPNNLLLRVRCCWLINCDFYAFIFEIA